MGRDPKDQHRSPDGLALPEVARPLVSIILPVYGHVPMTIDCLASIGRAGSRHPFEVIVIDDCSPGDDLGRLNEVENLRIHRNSENLGFLRSCNRGIAEANGEFLLFLNNDTLVRPGWLDALVDTFDDHPEAGLVGSKLIYPEGHLQEAGSIVWRDGTAANYGHGGSPHAPRFNYLREVDYCSGASIMIRRSLMTLLGGFDEMFVPAYCEDADLAFQVRQAGYRVFYQPRSEVVHLEGQSSGTDERSGVKRYQAINQKKFKVKWAEVLHATAFPRGDFERAKSTGRRRQILFVESSVPEIGRSAGDLRTFELLRVLKNMDFDITYYPRNLERTEPGTRDLQEMGVECLYTHRGRITPKYVTRWIREFCSNPRQRERQWHRFLTERGDVFDYVIISRVDNMVSHLNPVRQHCPSARVVFDSHDLHHVRFARAHDITGDPNDARRASDYRKLEQKAIRQADATLVCNSVEKDILETNTPGAVVEVVPTIHSIMPRARGFAGRDHMLFVGGFGHAPNVDGVKYFVNEILPHVIAARPGARLEVVGSNTPDEVHCLAGPHVRVRGFVPDLEPLYTRVCLSIAPLRFGAGFKGKVGESLARGVPVVTTSIGAEGTGLVNEESAFISDDPQGFAAAIVLLLTDAEVWEQMSLTGQSVIAERTAPAAIEEVLRSLFARLDSR